MEGSKNGERHGHIRSIFEEGYRPKVISKGVLYVERYVDGRLDVASFSLDDDYKPVLKPIEVSENKEEA